MKTFRLPDLGEGLQDAEIVSWHVMEGERVVADQPLLSVETEKAVVEVPSPWSGVIAKLHGEPGDIVAINSALVEFEIEGASDDAGTVVGEISEIAEEAGLHTDEPKPATAQARPPKAAPAVRRLARERGIDLSQVVGTGPGRVITSPDLEAAVSQEIPAGFEALRGVRRAMARNMAKAQREVAATTVTDEAVVSHWAQDEDVTMRLICALVTGCQAEPALNAWFDGDRQARKLHAQIDLGIAVNTEDGLFVPVMRDAGNRTQAELRAGLNVMRTDIAARSVPPAELRGQTITLSNFGMLGGRHASLIVMPPQVAIVGAGRIRSEACVVDDSVRPGKVLPLSLTFDHRAVAGAEAARFLMAIKNELEQSSC